jgi:hypothetical protein
MYPAPGVAPLVAVIMSYIREDSQISEATAQLLENQTRAYLENRATLRDTAEVFHRYTGTSAPVERLRDIIHTNETPLPKRSGPPECCGRRKIRSWTLWDDQRLLAGIYRFGLDSWDIVAEFVGNGRTRAQCCQRWCRGLDPAIAKEPWTNESDDLLLTLVALHGNKCWTQIACELGNRCDVQCRYRYNQLAKTPNFESRMRAAAERTIGMCHIKRPRKRPAKRTNPDIVQLTEPLPIPGPRVRLPPITEIEAVMARLAK